MRKRNTSPQHNIATSAIGGKRPRQITRTPHVIERVTSCPARNKSSEGFFFLFLFSGVVWHLREVQRHSRISDWFPGVSATYDTVNNLHYKAHSWKNCPTKEPQHQFVKGLMWKWVVIFVINTADLAYQLSIHQLQAVKCCFKFLQIGTTQKNNIEGQKYEPIFFFFFPKTSIFCLFVCFFQIRHTVQHSKLFFFFSTSFGCWHLKTWTPRAPPRLKGRIVFSTAHTETL